MEGGTNLCQVNFSFWKFLFYGGHITDIGSLERVSLIRETFWKAEKKKVRVLVSAYFVEKRRLKGKVFICLVDHLLRGKEEEKEKKKKEEEEEEKEKENDGEEKVKRREKVKEKDKEENKKKRKRKCER